METLQKGQLCKVIKVDTGGLNFRRDSDTAALPDGTIITLESVEDHSSNEHKLYSVVYTYYAGDIKKEEKGWVDSNSPPSGTPHVELFDLLYIVNSNKGVRLRREPNLKERTQEGEKNIISVLPDGTIVTRENDKLVDCEKFIWYYIRNLNIMDQSGWVASNFLDEIIPYFESNDRDQVNRPLPPHGFGSSRNRAVIVGYVSYNTSMKFRKASLKSLPDDVIMGAVMYIKGGKVKRTSVEDWNAAAVKGYKITG